MKIPIKEIIELPEGVSAVVSDNVLSVKGPKGEVKRKFIHPKISVKTAENKIVVSCAIATRSEKKIIFSWLAHIRNMIRGSENPFIYKLKICSGHFPINVSLSNNTVIVKNFLGEKSPRTLKIKTGATVKINGEIITVESSDKEIAGNIASDLELLTVKRNRDLRIFQDGIYITDKPSRMVQK